MKKTSRRYISAKRRNRRQAYQKKVLTILVMAMAMVFVFCGFSAMGSTSQPEDAKMVYEAVIIEPGDTLWSIANVYASHTEDSVETYIKNVKKMNDLHGDRIVDGEALLIYYYNE